MTTAPRYTHQMPPPQMECPKCGSDDTITTYDQVKIGVVIIECRDCGRSSAITLGTTRHD